MNEERKRTILLVEDEAITAMAQKNMLERYGYNVVTIDTGEKAIQILKDENFVELLYLPGSKRPGLEQFGYKVIMANSAEKAIEVVKEHNEIELVLMDIDLGEGMNGAEAAEIILKHRNIPILFLSSHTERETVEKTEKITSYGYVVKNSSITVLDASIKMAFKLFNANKKIEDELIERAKTDKMLRFSETRYRRLFETTREGILILDAGTGMIIDVNPFLINLLGYSFELFMGKAIWDIGFMKDIIGNKDKFMELKKNKYVRYEDLPLETASGEIIEVEFISNVYEGISTKLIQCNIRDITDRKKAENIIQALLDEKNLTLKEVHHRIKNSMNTIKGLLYLQAETLTDQAAIDALKDTESRVQSMMLIYDKLYTSIDYMEISIKDYLFTLIDEIVQNFPNSDLVKVEKNIDDFLLDSKKLQSVGIIINELLTNIMKYAFVGRNDGVISLAVSLNGLEVSIKVQDNGKGISEEINLENSSGFGLMLVRSLVDQINGTIRLERDKGTAFILNFKK